MEPENRWLRFGLATNPYFPDPLSSTRNGERPITLFHGRERDLREVLDTIAGETSSLVLVEAPSGVGKSTFLAYVKHQLRGRAHDTEPPKYFAPLVEIGVQTDETYQTLLPKILYAFVQHASELHPKADWAKRFPTIHQARSFVTTLQNVGWSFGVGGTLPGGAGGQFGGAKTPAATPPAAGPILTPDFFQRLCRELLQLTRPPMQGIVVHVNNMDTLLGEEPSRAMALFTNLRDYFQTPRVHWVFLGPPGMRGDAVAPEKRVRDFVRSWIQLASLSANDVVALLRKRYEHYKVRPSYVEPTDPRLVEHLIEDFGGDLRGTLNALTLAHKHYQPIDPTPLKEAFALRFLQQHYHQHLEAVLRGKTLEILNHLLKAKKPEFVQDDAATVEKHQSSRSLRFSEMEREEAIRLVRQDGARKVYAFGGIARIAFEL